MSRLGIILTAVMGLAAIALAFYTLGGSTTPALREALGRWHTAGGSDDLSDIVQFDPKPQSGTAAELYLKAAAEVPQLSEEDQYILTYPQQARTRELERLVFHVEASLLLLERASAMDQCTWPQPFLNHSTGEIPPYGQGLGYLTRAMVAKAYLDARQNRWDDAAQSLVVVLRVADHIGQDPGLVALLTRINDEQRVMRALENLYLGKPIPEFLLRELNNRDYRHLIRQAVFAEGAAMISLYNEGKLNTAPIDLGKPYNHLPRYLHNDQNDENLQVGDDLAYSIDRWLPCYNDWGNPYFQQTMPTGLKPEESGVKDLPQWARFACNTVGVLGDANLRVAELETRREMIVAMNLIEQYRQRTRNYPKSATDFRLPNDPATGKPLRYLSMPGGYKLWSEASFAKEAGLEISYPSR